MNWKFWEKKFNPEIKHLTQLIYDLERTKEFFFNALEDLEKTQIMQIDENITKRLEKRILELIEKRYKDKIVDLIGYIIKQDNFISGLARRVRRFEELQKAKNGA